MPRSERRAVRGRSSHTDREELCQRRAPTPWLHVIGSGAERRARVQERYARVQERPARVLERQARVQEQESCVHDGQTRMASVPALE